MPLRGLYWISGLTYVLCAAAAGASPSPTRSPVPKPTGTKPFCATSNVTIPNGDFETGSLGPWGAKYGSSADANVTVVSPGAGGSKYAAQLEGSSSLLLGQYRIPACEATNYSVTFDYKVAAAAPDCKMQVSNPNGPAYNPGQPTHRNGVALQPQPGDWTSGGFWFGEYTGDSFDLEARVDCASGGSATLLLDNFQIAAVGSLDPPGCPRDASVPNGGFESGDTAPWQVSGAPGKAQVQESVVSPGYNGSKHAVQVDIPDTADSSGITFLAHTVDFCVAYDYTYSIAVNWGNYSYSSGAGSSNGCELMFSGSRCSNKNKHLYFQPKSPGQWQEISIDCRPSTNLPTELYVSLDCFGSTNDPVPAFSMQIDSVDVNLAT